MSPTPPRQPTWTCSACGAQNEQFRSSCRNCRTPRSSVTPFRFPATGQQVRTVLVDGEPWFVAADVCAVLGIAETHRAVASLDDDEKGRHSMTTPGGQQLVTIVSEAGLYSLILRSRKPEARAFKRWITHEVLPAIRQTGSYSTTSAVPDMTTPQGRLQVLEMAMAAERRALEAEEKIAALEPDAARARRTLDSNGLALVGTVAKRFGIKEKALREFLYAEKLLIRGGSRHNEPYARNIEAGHFELKTRLVDVNPDRAPEERSTTFVTPKGEALIWKRLYAAGLVASPVMPAEQLAIEGGA